MRQPVTLKCAFVTAVPAQLEERTLYVSIDYKTVVHQCCCGCGHEVVTPLSPTDWKLSYDGVTVSLHPSVGNWSFPCQSHYWIDKNTVKWAGRWSKEQIQAGRARDRVAKDGYFTSAITKAEQGQRRGTKALDGVLRSWLTRWWR